MANNVTIANVVAQENAVIHNSVVNYEASVSYTFDPITISPEEAPVPPDPEVPVNNISPPISVASEGVSQQVVTVSKVHLESSDMNRFIEIRPPIRRLPNEIPIYIEMLDSGGNPCAIQVSNGTIIQALRLAPNPDTFTINSAKIVSRYNTMTRWVEEHWGDELDTVSISGSTFSFFAYDAGRYAKAPGLTVASRNNTEAYKMLKNLVSFYRTNGFIYQDSSTYYTDEEIKENNKNFRNPLVFLERFPDFKQRHPREGMIRERMYLRMTLDYVSFLGYFESFDIVEDSSIPYRFTYNMSFKSERTKYIVG